MFAKLTTKIALRKAGIPSNGFNASNFESKPSSSKDPNGNELLPFANPFANISVPKSWHSWATPPPPPVEVVQSPVIGTRAPSSMKLRLPGQDGRPTVVVFLRNTGCACKFSPVFLKLRQKLIIQQVAEKNFLELRRLANKYPNIHCIAVSHSSQAATDKWTLALGGKWAVEIVIDEERELYANWGLGISNSWHLISPAVGVAARKLGTEDNIWPREVDPSGNRWQTGGAWATDKMGTVRWGGASKWAAEIPDLQAACAAVGSY
jgi:hypothetical protein